MGLQADLKEALDDDREDLIRVLAAHGVRPAVVDREGSNLLGDDPSPTFRLDAEDGTSVVDRQTTVRVVDALGLETEADNEAVREDIAEHSAWDA